MKELMHAEFSVLALSYCLPVEAEDQLDWEEIGDEEVVDEDGWMGGSGMKRQSDLRETVCSSRRGKERKPC